MNLPDPLITSSPQRMGGTPVFAGTRVPIQNLFDYVERGDPLDEFLRSFPNVSREHAIAVLQASKAALILRSVENEAYVASADELAAVDEAMAQVKRGERATDVEVAAAFARFRP